jgi:hypothetical protein
MPKIYRSMKKELDDKPIVDATGKGLGVRSDPVNGVVDIDVDDAGMVLMNGKGMSVAPAWRDLPIHLISQRLRTIFPAARGRMNLYCFSSGEGNFANGKVSDSLTLVVDQPKHGVVAPARNISVTQYQDALSDTRDNWNMDES